MLARGEVVHGARSGRVRELVCVSSLSLAHKRQRHALRTAAARTVQDDITCGGRRDGNSAPDPGRARGRHPSGRARGRPDAGRRARCEEDVRMR